MSRPKFHTRMNVRRVEEIVRIVELILRSAESNRAAADDLAELLDPVVKLLAPPRPHPPTAGAPPAWVTIREVAAEAPLDDFPVAIAVYQDRLTDALQELKGKA